MRLERMTWRLLDVRSNQLSYESRNCAQKVFELIKICGKGNTSSGNWTRGSRLEGGYVTTTPKMFMVVLPGIEPGLPESKPDVIAITL